MNITPKQTKSIKNIDIVQFKYEKTPGFDIIISIKDFAKKENVS
jgi:hypothetical protein